MNYIYCAHEPEERLYRVYDSDGLLVPAEFSYGQWGDPVWVTQLKAEKLAKQLATKMGCDWGTNYP